MESSVQGLGSVKLTSGEDIRPFDMDELVVQISISEKEGREL